MLEVTFDNGIDVSKTGGLHEEIRSSLPPTSNQSLCNVIASPSAMSAMFSVACTIDSRGQSNTKNKPGKSLPIVKEDEDMKK